MYIEKVSRRGACMCLTDITYAVVSLTPLCLNLHLACYEKKNYTYFFFNYSSKLYLI